MQTYENAYFGLRIDFPATWKLVSWKHSKIGSSWRSLYQTADDNLPRRGKCESKFLFTACLYDPECAAMVDADVEVSVFRLAKGEDMRQSLLENLERERAYYESNGITTSITQEGTLTISGVDFGYVDEKSMSRNRISQYRFFFRHIDGDFELYGKIAGHSRGAFAKAIEIVEAMQCSLGSTSIQNAAPRKGGTKTNRGVKSPRRNNRPN